MVQKQQNTSASKAQQPLEQNTVQVSLQQEQTAVEKVRPHYPTWPTSKQGPRSTPPPPGMRSIIPIRAEQVAEIGYNQATGEPGTESPFRSLPDANATGPTGFDQQLTAQEALHRRKHRVE